MMGCVVDGRVSHRLSGVVVVGGGGGGRKAGQPAGGQREQDLHRSSIQGEPQCFSCPAGRAVTACNVV